MNQDILDNDLASNIKKIMGRDFDVSLINMVTGNYTFLLSYYAKNKIYSYIAAQKMYDDLGEVVNTDY